MGEIVGLCDYHQCRKKEKLKQCKFCKKFFCNKHITPKIPSMAPFGNWGSKDEAVETEYRKEDAHPCPSYVEHFSNSLKKQKDDYGIALGKLLGNKNKQNIEIKTDYQDTSKDIYPDEEIEEEYKSNEKKEKQYKTHHQDNKRENLKQNGIQKSTDYKREKSNIKKVLFIILVLIMVGTFAYLYVIQPSSKSILIDNCQKLLIAAVENEAFGENLKNVNLLDTNYAKNIDEAEIIIKNGSTVNNLDSLRLRIENAEYPIVMINRKIYKYGYSEDGTTVCDKQGILKLDGSYLLIDNPANSSSFNNPKYSNNSSYTNKDNQTQSKTGTPIISKAKDLESKASSVASKTIGSIGNFFDRIFDKTDIESTQIYEGSSNVNKGYPLQPGIDITSLENEIHNLINVERKNNGLRTLSFDSKLSDIARAHSQDMAQNNFFAHDNLRGQDPTDRANAKGYSCYKNYGSYYTKGIAENIFQNNLYTSITYINLVPFHDWSSQSEIASSTVQGWMNSPGHRENILTSTYDREGIGVAISGDDKVYITQDFC